MMMNEFSNFMNRKFAEYQLAQNRRVTVTEFAELLNVNQGDLSHWLKGRRPPQTISIVRNLANNPLIGPEVWKATGMIDPMPEGAIYRRALEAFEALPDDVLRERFLAEMEQAARKNQEKRSNAGGQSFQFAATG
jgi:transcriptional regulator with XRE-family HTH domain